MRDEILDERERRPRPHTKSIRYLYAVAIPCFLGWIVTDWVGWPHAAWLLGIGLLAMSVLTALRFYHTRDKQPYHYFYFLGRNALLVTIFLSFLNLPGFTAALWITFSCFAVGLLVPMLRKSG